MMLKTKRPVVSTRFLDCTLRQKHMQLYDEIYQSIVVASEITENHIFLELLLSPT